MLSGLPFITYNPINKNPIHFPINVHPKSMYVNFELDKYQKIELNHFMKGSGLELIPISLEKNKPKKFYISLNIYNCTSPLFLNDKIITRFEVNTYVKNKDNQNGTLILDYISNALSMDPTNYFKKQQDILYNNHNIDTTTDIIQLSMNYQLNDNDKPYLVDKELFQFTDIIYYMNGIYDKMFYDQSLITNPLKIPLLKQIHFNFHNIKFNKPNSIFYFDQEIRFVDALWANVYCL